MAQSAWFPWEAFQFVCLALKFISFHVLNLSPLILLIGKMQMIISNIDLIGLYAEMVY
jgi:hypothetical protein